MKIFSKENLKNKLKRFLLENSIKLFSRNLELYFAKLIESIKIISLKIKNRRLLLQKKNKLPNEIIELILREYLENEKIEKFIFKIKEELEKIKSESESRFFSELVKYFRKAWIKEFENIFSSKSKEMLISSLLQINFFSSEFFLEELIIRMSFFSYDKKIILKDKDYDEKIMLKDEENYDGNFSYYFSLFFKDSIFQ